MNPIGSAGPATTRDETEARRLLQAARQLEGVFVEQLFKAMRETVPDDGITNGGAGEQMFTGMLDQHLSDLVPQQWGGGLSDALMRQFRAAGVAAAQVPAASSTK